MSKVIAIDFDGCLVTNEYPKIGEQIAETYAAYSREKAAGSKFILWTCRTGDRLTEALTWCTEHDIHFEAVNENLPERVEHFGSDCRKISAEEYWDDRAVHMPPLESVPQNNVKERAAMPKFFRKLAPPVAIDKGVYSMAMADGKNAEITMYGEIVRQRPVDSWTGKPVDGSFIIQDEFLHDLEAVSKAKSLTLRMNSVGGDTGVSFLIHNRLRELAAKGMAITCIVDGVAMSGGSTIMCACDTVKVNPSSLIMIHKCWSVLFGGYNADELREMASTHDAWDKAAVTIYHRKTGLDETEIARMMAETTYMTGQEAVDKGFADSIIEDAEPLNIAASADGRSLFVRGREFHLCPGMFAPESVPTAIPEAKAPAENKSEGGNETMPNSVTSNQTPASPEPTPAIASEAERVLAERQRLKDIDAIASLLPAEMVEAAKYGENPCTAQELAYQAAVAASAKAAGEGSAFLAAMKADGEAAAQVGAAPSGEPQANGDSPQAAAAQAKADVDAFKKMKEVR